ncbi:hypothetical protein ANN_11441 [Periplaneta americana]|uniref:Uncharacterized protein n=1 Tax=Periplaneta americana TaxID=6978 RepID=A0ABQ8T7B8_PERAM|nr:hypothetical protein ANN_11441 [Periplaneta americana]
MAGLCEGGNEPPGSLKAIMERGHERLRLLKSLCTLGISYNLTGFELRPPFVENRELTGFVCLAAAWKASYT